MSSITLRCRKLWALPAAAAALSVSAPAHADTITLGPPINTAPDFGFAYEVPVTFANGDPRNESGGTSPVDGTVIEWNVRANADVITPRVLRRNELGGSFTGMRSGPPAFGAGLGLISGPYEVSMPIRAGELFGVTMEDATGIEIESYTAPGARALRFNSRLLDGSSAVPNNTYSNETQAVSATIRYCEVPALKGLSPAQARAALRGADCTPGPVTKAKKRTKKRRVVSQGHPPGTRISDTEPVSFKVSRKRRK